MDTSTTFLPCYRVDVESQTASRNCRGTVGPWRTVSVKAYRLSLDRQHYVRQAMKIYAQSAFADKMSSSIAFMLFPRGGFSRYAHMQRVTSR